MENAVSDDVLTYTSPTGARRNVEYSVYDNYNDIAREHLDKYGKELPHETIIERVSRDFENRYGYRPPAGTMEAQLLSGDKSKITVRQLDNKDLHDWERLQGLVEGHGFEVSNSSSFWSGLGKVGIKGMELYATYKTVQAANKTE
jgi:hypothetical protein